MKKFLKCLCVVVFMVLSRESTAAKQITANDRQKGAEEQAHRFCEENGLGFDKVNPITGKPIRLIVCAIRDDVGARDAERKFFADRLIKERQEAYERGRRDEADA